MSCAPQSKEAYFSNLEKIITEVTAEKSEFSADDWDALDDEIEKYTGYNKFYFSHLFKVKTNSTIGEYVNHVRIRYTAEADVYGMKHKDIATAIGFSSISAYCQWKRKYKNKIEELKEQIKRELKSEKKNI